MPNPAGTLVAFTGGDSYSSHYPYVADVSGATPKVIRLTAAPDYTSDLKLFTPDNKYIIYWMGPSWDKLDLRIQPVTGGSPWVLEPVAGSTAPVLAL